MATRPAWPAITRRDHALVVGGNERYPGAGLGSYVVSSGDTLHSLALAVYGDARLWLLIAQGNLPPFAIAPPPSPRPARR